MLFLPVPAAIRHGTGSMPWAVWLSIPTRCTGCHMPAIAAAEHESPLHTREIRVAPLEKTLQSPDKGGMPNACAASCHGDKVNLWDYGMKANPVIWNQSVDVKTETKLIE